MKRETAPIFFAAILMFALLLSSCSPAAAPKVTGVVEDGEMTVWLSPGFTEMRDRSTKYSSSKDWPSVIASYTSFTDDIKYVTYDKIEDFEKAITQNILKGESPDLILACNGEISYKQIKSGAFFNLFPYLDFEYSREGGIKREDILTPDFKGLTFDGKLYMLPLDFALYGLATTKEADAKYGLGIAGKGATLEDMFELYLKWEPKQKLDYFLAPPWIFYPTQVYPDLIDYEKGTTYISDQKILDKFNKVIAKSKEMNKKYQELYKDNNNSAYEAFISKMPLCLRVNNGYAYNWTTAYHLGTFSSDLFWQDNNLQLQNESGDELIVLPFRGTKDNAKYLAESYMFALIPANAKHPQKAFEYIKTVYTKDFSLLERLQGIPLNKQVLKATIETSDLLTAEEKDTLYGEITGETYRYNWTDSTISGWIEALTDKMWDENRDATRQEWDELTNKIKLFLTE